eukprot:TRINITY_DN597_c2_g1_i1.p1 TRINITY_DN597_c2_g1~~TRINITY_DN597_c2_g1_i1.p1  ORF type:complete len:1127 (-),score=295.82 TRINITY_DN597_c2_g1_i1:160-3540(-)
MTDLNKNITPETQNLDNSENIKDVFPALYRVVNEDGRDDNFENLDENGLDLSDDREQVGLDEDSHTDSSEDKSHDNEGSSLLLPVKQTLSSSHPPKLSKEDLGVPQDKKRRASDSNSDKVKEKSSSMLIIKEDISVSQDEENISHDSDEFDNDHVMSFLNAVDEESDRSESPTKIPDLRLNLDSKSKSSKHIPNSSSESEDSSIVVEFSTSHGSSSQLDQRPTSYRFVEQVDGSMQKVKRDDQSTDEFIHLNGGIFIRNSDPLIDDKGKKFLIEPTTSFSQDVEIKRLNTVDIYDTEFFSRVHINFIGTHNTKKEEHIIVSVLKRDGNKGKYYCLKTHKKGSDVFYIDPKELKMSSKSKSSSSSSSSSKQQSLKIHELVIDHLTQNIKDYSFYLISNPNFPQDLRQIEMKHPQKQKTMKVAFMYSKGGEKTLQDLFQHREMSPNYLEFLEVLGQKINLKGWKKYRGDIGVEIEMDSYYTEWKGIEVMFHICLWMNPEQHRRLIGNDVIFILFHDNNEPFDPGPLDSLGTVPQVFGVVQRYQDELDDKQECYYRMGFFSRPNIKSFEPLIPEHYYFPKSELKDFLFTKLYNGFCQALSCPPMNRLFEVPRANTIIELVNKYPHESKKIRDIRSNSEKKKRKLIIQSSKARDPIFMLVTVVKCVPPREVKDPLLSIKVLDKEEKTKVTKGKCSMKDAITWNETLAFNIVAVDPEIDFVKVELKESAKSHKHVGQSEISFLDICKTLEFEKWFELESISKTGDSLPGGVVCLKFSLKGPPDVIVICPKCKLFIGIKADVVIWNNTRYHIHCITCSKCSKHINSKEFREYNGSFFCRKCFTKEYGDIPPSDSLMSLPTPMILTSSSSSSTTAPNTPGNSNSSLLGLNSTDSDGITLGPVFVPGLDQKIDINSPHTWTETTFTKPLSWCGFCGELTGMGGHGFVCSECKYPCHTKCKDLIPPNCSHDPKTQELHSTPPAEMVKKAVNAKRKSLKLNASATFKIIKGSVKGESSSSTDSPIKSEPSITVTDTPTSLSVPLSIDISESEPNTPSSSKKSRRKSEKISSRPLKRSTSNVEVSKEEEASVLDSSRDSTPVKPEKEKLSKEMRNQRRLSLKQFGSMISSTRKEKKS